LVWRGGGDSCGGACHDRPFRTGERDDLKATEAALRADVVALSTELKGDIAVITGDLRRTEVALLGDLSKVHARD
jgi:hypothetical protein